MSYKVIARKYRPSLFSEVVGQEHVTRTLANAIQSNRVAHAYIFSGVRGVGKTTTARILAKALNCVKGATADPDNTCDSCVGITAGTSLDVLEIDAASNRGIDQIRELREMVRYAPANSRYKVVILDEAHQLTDEASNALLKTLEEPPDRVVFILATTRADALSETIKSRAQLFQFRALSFAEIAGEIERIAKQEKLKIEPGAVAVLARAAEGSLRDGLSLLEQAISYSDDTVTDANVRELLGVVAESVLDDLVNAISQQSAEKALSLVHRLIGDGQNLQHFCRESIRHFRNLLVAKVCGAEAKLVEAPEEERPRLAEQAARFSEEDLTRFFNLLLATDAELRRAPDPRLHLEMGLLKLINAKRLAPLEELLAELRGGDARPATRASGGDFSGGGSSGSASGRAGGGPPSGARSPGARFSGYAVGASMTAQAVSTTGAAVRMAAFPPAHAATVPSISGSRSFAPPPSFAQKLAPRPLVAEPAKEIEPAATAIAAPAPVASVETVESEVEPTLVSTAPTNGDSAHPLTDAQVEAIKDGVASHRFLATLIDSVAAWQISSSEVHLVFPAESRNISEMLQAKDPMDKLRTVLNQVLGQPLRVCVKLDATRTPASPHSELRARFEEDPIVRAMIQKFGGQISNVKRPGEE
jgi:DNA polymerase-3 subunit gamma/tau